MDGREIDDAADALARECPVRLPAWMHGAGRCVHCLGRACGRICCYQGGSAPPLDMPPTAAQESLWRAQARREG